MRIAQKGFNRNYSGPLPQLSQWARIQFKEELDLLSNLLGQVYRFEGPDEVVAYSLRECVFQKFIKALMRLQEGYDYYPTINADGTDPFPTWGLKGSPVGYWLKLDFKVQCACYWWDVEQFLEGLYKFINPGNNTSTSASTKSIRNKSLAGSHEQETTYSSRSQPIQVHVTENLEEVSQTKSLFSALSVPPSALAAQAPSAYNPFCLRPPNPTANFLWADAESSETVVEDASKHQSTGKATKENLFPSNWLPPYISGNTNCSNPHIPQLLLEITLKGM
jgi:hypothetical protein